MCDEQILWFMEEDYAFRRERKSWRKIIREQSNTFKVQDEMDFIRRFLWAF